ncbi:MAG TPA: DinB family protein [Acidobacteriaceae bacterium]|nr:DinB family protein [Acidobacteriaceae bacterium]
MPHSLDNTLTLLERTPAALDALLRGLPDAWVRRDEGEGTWTARDVVAHLAQLEESDWMPRVRRVLKHGEGRAFDPVDRRAFVRTARGKSLTQLLARFARLRKKNLKELRALGLRRSDFRRRGLHPALGVVTLGELVAAWAAHDLTHLHQIARVLAYQYREDVGAWDRYLGVLQCRGHSASA